MHFVFGSGDSVPIRIDADMCKCNVFIGNESPEPKTKCVFRAFKVQNFITRLKGKDLGIIKLVFQSIICIFTHPIVKLIRIQVLNLNKKTILYAESGKVKIISDSFG